MRGWLAIDIAEDWWSKSSQDLQRWRGFSLQSPPKIGMHPKTCGSAGWFQQREFTALATWNMLNCEEMTRTNMVSTNATLWRDIIFWYFPPNEVQQGVSEIGVRSYLANQTTGGRSRLPDRCLCVTLTIWQARDLEVDHILYRWLGNVFQEPQSKLQTTTIHQWLYPLNQNTMTTIPPSLVEEGYFTWHVCLLAKSVFDP